MAPAQPSPRCALLSWQYLRLMLLLQLLQLMCIYCVRFLATGLARCKRERSRVLPQGEVLSWAPGYQRERASETIAERLRACCQTSELRVTELSCTLQTGETLFQLKHFCLLQSAEVVEVCVTLLRAREGGGYIPY
mmetsp:Transcript_7886/g.21532  ORF Transcript_7886/g.21532 Transcript_7886/m.21532 type:complete len:136 (-) Transcript_7886:1071-1478(-)